MDKLVETAGVNPMDMGARVALAVQGTLIIFFIVSPVMGFLLARGIQSRVNFVLSWCVGMFVTLVGGFGMNLLLRRAIPVETMSNLAITLLSAAASLAFGILLARYLTWWMGEPGKPAWAIEQENIDPDEMMPHEKRRRDEMERRKRR